jgi:hypothetical protein
MVLKILHGVKVFTVGDVSDILKPGTRPLNALFCAPQRQQHASAEEQCKEEGSCDQLGGEPGDDEVVSGDDVVSGGGVVSSDGVGGGDEEHWV